jgi:ATP-binding cassette subfamily F protein 3
LERLAKELRAIELQLASPDIYNAENKRRLGDLLASQRGLATELAQVETEWLAMTEELETAEKSVQIDS